MLGSELCEVHKDHGDGDLMQIQKESKYMKSQPFVVLSEIEEPHRQTMEASFASERSERSGREATTGWMLHDQEETNQEPF